MRQFPSIEEQNLGTGYPDARVARLSGDDSATEVRTVLHVDLNLKMYF